MSAWVTSKAHIDAMVQAAIDFGGTYEPYGYMYWGENPAEPQKVEFSPATAQAIGERLMVTIVQAVSHRYPDDDVSKGELPGPTDGWYLRPYTFERHRVLDDAEVAALVSCYEYQACEHNDWPNTFGWKFCEYLNAKLLSRLKTRWEAENNDKLPWGFEDVDLIEYGDEPRSFTVYLGSGAVEVAYVTATSKREAGELAVNEFGGRVLQVRLGIPESEPDTPEEAEEAPAEPIESKLDPNLAELLRYATQGLPDESPADGPQIRNSRKS